LLLEGPDCVLGNVSELIARCSLLSVDKDNITGVRMQQGATLALSKYMLVGNGGSNPPLKLVCMLGTFWPGHLGP